MRTTPYVPRFSGLKGTCRLLANRTSNECFRGDWAERSQPSHLAGPEVRSGTPRVKTNSYLSFHEPSAAFPRWAMWQPRRSLTL